MFICQRLTLFLLKMFLRKKNNTSLPDTFSCQRLTSLHSRDVFLSNKFTSYQKCFLGLNLPLPPIPCERRFLFVVVVVCFFFPPKINLFSCRRSLCQRLALSQAKEFALPLELPSKKLPQRQAIKLTST